MPELGAKHGLIMRLNVHAGQHKHLRLAAKLLCVLGQEGTRSRCHAVPQGVLRSLQHYRDLMLLLSERARILGTHGVATLLQHS